MLTAWWSGSEIALNHIIKETGIEIDWKKRV